MCSVTKWVQLTLIYKKVHKNNLLFFSGILTTFNLAVFGIGKLLRDVEHQLEKKTFICSTFAYKYLRAIHELIGGEKLGFVDSGFVKLSDEVYLDFSCDWLIR